MNLTPVRSAGSLCNFIVAENIVIWVAAKDDYVRQVVDLVRRISCSHEEVQNKAEVQIVDSQNVLDWIPQSF